jgi:hypothetical protein
MLADGGAPPSFTVAFTPVLNSNLNPTPPLAIAFVRAGVPYNVATLASDTVGALGADPSATIRGKLVSLGTTDCSLGTAIGSPWDGVTAPSTIYSTYLVWGTPTSPITTKFPFGGQYTLCYFSALLGTSYQVLPITINVNGIVGSNYKIFCLASNLLTCSGRLFGLNLPTDSSWKLATTLSTSSGCGSSAFATPFQSRISSLVTTSTSSFEIHDFGYIKTDVPPATYKLCYCTGYQAILDISGAYCKDDSTGYMNFLQDVGNLIILSIRTTNPRQGNTVSIFPRMRVNLSLLCGTGGCDISKFKTILRRHLWLQDSF